MYSSLSGEMIEGWGYFNNHNVGWSGGGGAAHSTEMGV